MKWADIYSALATHYQAADIDIETFWPNKDETPTAGKYHARVWFIPANNDAGSLGGTGVDRLSGILQIDLMCPTNIGIGHGMAHADAIAAAFQRGDSETYNTTCVVFTGTTINGPRNEDGWLRTVISVGWYAHVARSVP
jgi:hypothetical protein